MVKDQKIDLISDNFLLTVVFDVETSWTTITLSPLDKQLPTEHSLVMHDNAHVRRVGLFLQKLAHF